ncbi:glycosyltransferase family 2 protein [Halomonas stenophila]|uniref:Glycosyltransferase involved in cell wall biosynthesis n=1 Tax=Halomonas stenophila TaxID=795312 RepID=A0A7W5HJK7_9GAMM|nr:glycosyltransferase family A protein [Halomonas stenophila]MBB3229542.1 glycosyltransferase involved in cell wall biosynthesis [Halomonas stenophila]
MRPLVSVIIPVHNKGDYVSRALQSVLDQSYPRLEVLVVDDASRDDSLARVARFDDARIRVLRRECPGPGGYAARNLGIQQARGDWVAFLDADDVWLLDHLDQSMGIAVRYPEIALISAARLLQRGGRQQLDAFAERFMPRGPQVLHLTDYLKQACQGRRAMGTNSVLIKRAALDTHRVFPEGRTQRSGDLYAWVELLARLKYLVWSPHVASVHHGDVIGVSRNNIPSMALFRDMVEDLRAYTTQEDEKWLKIYANQMIKYAWLEQKKKREALPVSALPGAFYWTHGRGYCLKWTMLSLVPFGVLEWLKQHSPAD